VCAKSLAPTAAFAMATTQNFVAKQAWQTMIIHNRTEFMAYLDETTHDACQYWGRYRYFDENDNGPSELYNPEWYRRNVAWGPWLCEANRWAKIRDEKVHERLVAFHKMCALYHMLFKDRERFDDDRFCVKVKDAIAVIECYLCAWKYAVTDQTIERWARSHRNA
jgi:hypothetical protein